MYIYIYIVYRYMYIYTQNHQTHFDLADSRRFVLLVSACVLGMAYVTLQAE